MQGAKRGAKKRVTLPDMTVTASRRRGYGEDAIYFDAAKNRYVGAISVGFGPGGKRLRRNVTGRTKAEVRDKLKAAHNELDRGLHTSATYTVRQAVDDWLEGGLPGRSERTRSIYREALKPLLEHIGLKPLRELTARDVRRGLEALSRKVSTRYLQLARASLARAIRYAEAHDLVGRNVATLVDNPKGQVGRPSSFTLEQSLALLEAARKSRLNAYVVLSLATGIRTEEARELHWDHVDLDGDPSAARPVPPSVAVWRSVREGGDTKTAKSRRTLALPQAAVEALRDHRKRQAEDRLAAGSLWQDHGLVFASAIGTPLDAANVRREFRQVTETAGLGLGWAPRDLRHTFVSLMSADGVPIEDRPPGRPQPHRDHRTRLPPRAAPRHHHRRRGNGPDPELAWLTGFRVRPTTPAARRCAGRLPDVPLGVASRLHSLALPNLAVLRSSGAATRLCLEARPGARRATPLRHADQFSSHDRLLGAKAAGFLALPSSSPAHRV